MCNTEISFPPWYSLQDTINSDKWKNAGVYIIAHSEKHPKSNPRDLPENIIYIGQTRKNINHRLKRFMVSGTEGKKGHKGGLNYYNEKEKNHYLVKNLYVTASVVDHNELGRNHPVYIRFLERYLLWDYVKTSGQLPVCNKE